MDKTAAEQSEPNSDWTPDKEFAQAVSGFCDDRKLTPREKQIALLVCTGMKNTSIATQLGVSEATVRLHITNIHRKLNTGSKVEIVIQAFQWWMARCRCE